MSTVFECQQDFAFNIFKKLFQNDCGKNECISPYSILHSLVMLLQGAEGETKNQLNRSIFSDNQISISELFRLLLIPYSDSPSIIWYIANRLYCCCEKVDERYLDDLKKYYQLPDSVVSSIDPKQDSYSLSRLINEWVKEKTNDKIPDLVTAETFKDTFGSLLAINAVYFQADWKTPFSIESTTEKLPFYISANTSRDVDTMRAKIRNLKLRTFDECQMLGVPYKARNLTMYFILPRDLCLSKLVELENQFCSLLFMQMIDSLHYAEVEVQIPVFKIEQIYDMKKCLENVGVKDAFTNKADFSKISKSNDLYLSTFIHKVVVEVNEGGTLTASETSTKKCRMDRPAVESEQFTANHPFIFIVFEEKTKSILFIGHFCGG